LHWHLPNSARNLAETKFGRIWEKWPNLEFAEAEAEIRYNPKVSTYLLSNKGFWVTRDKSFAFALALDVKSIDLKVVA